MDWIQVATLAGINIALFAALASLIVWVIGKLDSDIKGVGERVDNLGERVDKLGVRLDGHASRIDQLYKMFVDLLQRK